MKNYVIINGVNSLTITGLAISKLPSISKPPLRVMTEEINGRDGDLITELGYGAYDKELVIGLYGNYDINEVIGFFNQEGTIVFSNEDDKYYNFKIINQIDYEALIKFRTATINLHCQPFKYPLTETPEEITTEYVEDEGETITLNNTKIAPLTIDLKGNTTQTGTPTPSSPIPVNVVSGDNEIEIVGKNLLNIQTFVKGRLDNGNVGYDSGTTSITTTQDSITFTTNANYRGITSDFIIVEPSIDYILHQDTSLSGISISTACYDSNKTFLGNATTTNIDSNTKKYTMLANTNFFRLNYQSNSVGTTTINKPQLEKGNSSSTYEPYQSQNYPLYLGVENLLQNGYSSGSQNGITYIKNQDGTMSVNGTATANTFMVLKTFTLPAGTYTLSGCPSGGSTTTYKQDILVGGSVVANDIGSGATFTLNSSTSIDARIRIQSGTTINSLLFKPMIEVGSKVNEFTPYGTIPIELCKIGTYQDYFYKDNGKWYLHKEVGKVVLNGSETINNCNVSTGNSDMAYAYTTLLDNYIANSDGISDKLIKSNVELSIGTNSNDEMFSLSTSWAGTRFYIAKSRLSEVSVAGFKTWLSNNNITIYYPLATPTNTEITDSTLINQLESLKGAMSYEGQTNISQVNNDLPFILSVKGIKEGSGEGIINNIGNIYAKPIIELEGTGTIGIYKNGTQYFEVDMSSDNEITIDTENMEAYHDGVLKNRKVIGDYNKFTIDEGNNNIEITGELTKATISNYTRWL